MTKLKIGVLGVGHLGRIHLKCIQLTPLYELVGFYDPDDANAEKALEGYEVKRFTDVDALIAAVDVIDIVTPTTTHFELAAKAILAKKHIFVEKPLTTTVKEAEGLLDLLKKYQVKGQVGHVERFNPALLALKGQDIKPMFIEAHRLSNYNPRSTDVSVVLDLMIHDLDIVLKLMDAEVEAVSASGVPVISATPDIANARVEFTNGAVANFTASRISLKQMRKLRVFQPNAYLSLDFLEKRTEIVRLYDEAPEGEEDLMELDTGKQKRYIKVDMPEIEPVNAIQQELQSLAESILEDKPVAVSIEDGLRALQLAHDILQKIEERLAANSDAL